MSALTPQERADHAMKRIVRVIGSEMGWTNRGKEHDAAYLKIILDELRIDLRLLEIRLVEHFTKYPFEPYLGFSVREVRQRHPDYVRNPIYDQGGLGDYDSEDDDG